MHAIYRLRSALVTRTRQLANGDWQRGKKGYWPILDCPPRPGTWLPEARTCDVYYYCPFCWVRRVLEPNYDRIASFFYKQLQPRSKSKILVPADILLAHKYQYLPLDTDFSEVTSELINGAYDIFHRRLIDPAGMIYLCTMEPYDVDVIQVHSRHLVVLPPDVPYSTSAVLFDDDNVDVSFLRYSQSAVDLASIYLAVADCCEYPDRLMLGDLKTTGQILAQRHRPLRRKSESANLSQMSAIYGRLRDLSEYEQDQRYRSALREALA